MPREQPSAEHHCLIVWVAAIDPGDFWETALSWQSLASCWAFSCKPGPWKSILSLNSHEDKFKWCAPIIAPKWVVWSLICRQFEGQHLPGFWGGCLCFDSDRTIRSHSLRLLGACPNLLGAWLFVADWQTIIVDYNRGERHLPLS